MILKPGHSEYSNDAFFAAYINKADGAEALSLMQPQYDRMLKFFKNLDESAASFTYAPNKWTLKEMLGHMIDTERIVQYRALCIARGEKQTLPSFDENEYVQNAHFQTQSLAHMLKQYKAVRQATILLFESFEQPILDTIGQIGTYFTSVRTLAWFIMGHEQHHFRILHEKYNQEI